MILAALLTCHNRREKTLTALDAFFAQESRVSVRLRAFLVDAGSSDGTRQAVAERFSQVTIVPADPTVFWCTGMRRAYAAAKLADPDYFLWLNDDTILDADAIPRLLAADCTMRARGEERAIIVGSTRDPETGAHTYGGVEHSGRWHPFDYRLVPPGDVARRCKTFNGNCALIPRSVACRVGNLDRSFRHGMGDTDYGLRAWREGCSVWIAPGYFGTCSRNDTRGTWQDVNLPLPVRWRKIREPKGLPPAEWGAILRRHTGPLWPIYWASPYASVLLQGFCRFFASREA